MPEPSNVPELLRLGFAAHRAGDAATANACYAQVLRLAPEEPDALQLLGLLAKERGATAEAEDCWRRSLRARPAQPHVLNNLANLLSKTSREAEAERCLLDALRLRPDYADAHYNLARLRHTRGDLDGAERSARAAIAASTRPTASMLQLHAQVLADDGRLREALVVLDGAVAQFPTAAALQHNRAVVLHRLGRHEESLAAHEAARALGLDDADAHYNRGNTLQALGQLDAAARAYGEALRLQPDHRLALYDLARLRWRRGDSEFDAELREARSRSAADATPALVHGHLQWRAERYEEARGAFEEALLRCRGDVAKAEALDGLARCLVRLGDFDQGLDAHERAVALAPRKAELRVNHAASLLVAGRAAAAASVAQAALAVAPEHQHALALLGLAWRSLGDPRECWLNDYERFVGVFDLTAGAGADVPWLAPLAAYLESLHVDGRAPVDQTLRGGTQTFGNLFERRHPELDAARSLIEREVDAYVAGLARDAAHPFLARQRGQWRFAGAWSSRLGRAGFHTDHIHPYGWISAAFYVRVPQRCGDVALREGWLRFGQPDLDTSRLGLADCVRRVVQPRAGTLVLFPSMMWHGTTPFESDETRLTISFDVVPA